MSGIHFVNCTPHPVVMNDGRVFEPSGHIARVKSNFTEIQNDLCSVQYGELEDIPQSHHGTLYIVSSIAQSASSRKDLVVPATGHPECVRDNNGHIVSVPCFLRK